MAVANRSSNTGGGPLRPARQNPQRFPASWSSVARHLQRPRPRPHLGRRPHHRRPRSQDHIQSHHVGEAVQYRTAGSHLWAD